MEKINIAELLKDCPPGMELDCTMYENVTLKYVSVYKDEDYPICIETKSGLTRCLTKYGQNICNDDAKCVIFPKGKTTWDGFQGYFKDGDIVATESGDWIGITSGGEIHELIPTYCIVSSNDNFGAHLECKSKWRFARLATEEEKQKLFEAIEDNGYKWNTETKTLEKLIVPKFKVGDKITNGEDSLTISHMDNRCYYNIKGDTISRLFIEYQDNWKLIPSNKFDISTLKSFESKVLVRDYETNAWKPAIFGFYIDDCHEQYKYVVVGGIFYKYLIPYEGNEHLLGKTDDCDKYYKVW